MTYAIILSRYTPICVSMHRDGIRLVLYLYVVRHNIIRETSMKWHHRMHNTLGKAGSNINQIGQMRC